MLRTALIIKSRSMRETAVELLMCANPKPKPVIIVAKCDSTKISGHAN